MRTNLRTRDKENTEMMAELHVFLQMNQNEAVYNRALSGVHTDLWLLQLPDTNG